MNAVKRVLDIVMLRNIRSIRSFWNGRNGMVFLFFLIISTSFWFLNALRKNYSTNIIYPIEYINLPEGKLISTETPTDVIFKVRGSGFTLLRYHLGRKFYPINVDFNKIGRFQYSGRRSVKILAHDLLPNFSSQLSNDLELIEVKPDTLSIVFINKVTKKVPVVFNGNLSFSQPFYQSGRVVITPDSVIISGPDNVLDTIVQVSTNFQTFTNIQDTLHKKVDLTNINMVELSNNHVIIDIPSESFTETSLEIPLIVRGIVGDYNVKTFPAEVKVTFRVGLSQYEKIKMEHFIAIIDLNGVDINSQSKLKVKLDKLPEFIYAVDYSPLFVDFLIERKQ